MGLALEPADRGVRLVVHLDVEDLDAIEPHRGRLVDAGGDPEPFAPELPEGVGRDADRMAPACRVPSLGLLPVARVVLALRPPDQPDRRGRPGDPGAPEELSPIRPHGSAPRFDP